MRGQSGATLWVLPPILQPRRVGKPPDLARLSGGGDRHRQSRPGPARTAVRSALDRVLRRRPARGVGDRARADGLERDRRHDVALLLYGPLSTVALAASPRLRRSPVVWAIDFAVTLALVVESGDWRSPYYMLWLAALALPAAYLPLRHAVWLALRRAARVPARRDLGRPGAGPPGGRLDRDAGDPPLAADAAGRLARLRARHAAAALGGALAARAARDRGRAPPDRVGAARLGQAAAARRAPARLLAGRARRRAAGADRRARRGRARVRRVGHGHEPRRAALAAGGPPARRRPAPARRRARARRASGDHRDRPRAAAAAADRRARLPDRLRGAHQRAAPRRRPARSTSASTPTRTACACSITDDGRGLPAERRPGANGLFAMESRAATMGATLTIAAADAAAAARPSNSHVPLDPNGAPP